MWIFDDCNGLLRFALWMAPARRSPRVGPPAGGGSGSANSAGGGAGESPDDFREIFEREFEGVLDYFEKRGFSREDALELTQDTFVRVYQYRDDFRGEASVRTWIFEIAKNVGNNEIRRLLTKKRKGKLVSLDAEAGEGGLEISTDQLPQGRKREPDALEKLLKEEKEQKLREVIQTMPPKMRRCVLMRIHGGLKYREIAALMEISIGTVKAHLSQAKALLERELKPYFDPFDL